MMPRETADYAINCAGPAEPVAPPLLVRRRAAARLCGLSVSAWDRLHAAGRVPAPIRLSGALCWRVAELAEWVDAGCPPRAEWEARQNATK